LGAITAEALAAREGVASPASARARLASAHRAGLMKAWRLLQGRPGLYTVTRAGLRAADVKHLEPAHVSPGGAAHAIACCEAAVTLALAFPGYEVLGEPAIRAARREQRPGALRIQHGLMRSEGADHRPDLLVVPDDRRDELPLAVEVELTLKSPRRLEAICRGWARDRSVAGVLYFAADSVVAPLGRAIERAGAGDRIVVLDL
jgi:hypothetical protein